MIDFKRLDEAVDRVIDGLWHGSSEGVELFAALADVKEQAEEPDWDRWHELLDLEARGLLAAEEVLEYGRMKEYVRRLDLVEAIRVAPDSPLPNDVAWRASANKMPIDMRTTGADIPCQY